MFNSNGWIWTTVMTQRYCTEFLVCQLLQNSSSRPVLYVTAHLIFGMKVYCWTQSASKEVGSKKQLVNVCLWPSQHASWCRCSSLALFSRPIVGLFSFSNQNILQTKLLPFTSPQQFIYSFLLHFLFHTESHLTHPLEKSKQQFPFYFDYLCVS